MEFPFDGPYRVGGPPRIRVFTTDRGVEFLRRFGLEPVYPVDGIGPVDSGDLGRAIGALSSTCWTTSACSLVTDDTFKDYGDIADELADLAATDGGIEVYGIGRTYLHGSSGAIQAIQFGPLESTSTPPTIYLIGTQHAREWMAMATTLQVARYLTDVVDSGYAAGEDFTDLQDALDSVAVVVVPVANPDGYDYTRASSRSWRGNRNTTSCSSGVDLNRNHTALWAETAETTASCFFDTYPGSSAGSEWETVAIETLIAGSLSGHAQEPIAVIDYHSYGDIVIHTAGYKASTDSIGPSCGLQPNVSNCISADHALTRDLFGDTHSGLHVDTVSEGGPFPYFRDSARNVLYTSSGALENHATFGSAPTLAMTVELPTGCTGFYIECDPDTEAFVKEAALDQLRVVARLAEAALALTSTSVSEAYGPGAVGALASGMWTREFTSATGLDEGSARATFTKAVWEHVDTGSLTAYINGTAYSYSSAREGVQYHLYSITAKDGDFDPLCLPCEIESFNNSVSGDDGALNCSECLDLCDDGRLSASSWDLETGTRGGADDCWWEPTGSSGYLEIPGGYPPFGSSTSHCHFTFSVIWGEAGNCGLEVQREAAGGGWETIYSVDYTRPYPPATLTPDGRLSSLVFEANNLLGSLDVPAFRIVHNNSATGTQVFDPVIYCRGGKLP